MRRSVVIGSMAAVAVLVTSVIIIETQRSAEPAFTAAARAQLKDPDAAKFTDLTVIEDVRNGKQSGLCGSVNSRNSYGGYTGFRRFVYIDVASRFAPEHMLMIDEEGEDLDTKRFAVYWQVLCAAELKKFTKSERKTLQGTVLSN